VEGYKALLEAAAAETGLDDFGVDAFREGLEILVTALRDEARLNPLGEKVLRDRIVGHLMQRLQIEDWYRRHPEIDDEQITMQRCNAPPDSRHTCPVAMKRRPNVWI
jgi:hypothetical protein